MRDDKFQRFPEGTSSKFFLLLILNQIKRLLLERRPLGFDGIFRRQNAGIYRDFHEMSAASLGISNYHPQDYELWSSYRRESGLHSVLQDLL